MLAMFLVLLVHADFYSLGAPALTDVQAQPLDSAVRIAVQNVSIVCVNVFVLISGWFGIRPKVRSITAFLFQCLFFLIGIYAVMLAAGWAQLSLNGVVGCFLLTKLNWFPKAYLVLYMLAPALNALMEQAPRGQVRLILVCFFLFQTVYDWVAGATDYLASGYSPLSFIGLYLLARYARVYRPRWAALSARADAGIYLLLVLLCTAVQLASSLAGGFVYAHVMARMVYYSNPAVIAAALYLLLAFSKLRLQSRAVNWFAASSFAVFLLHTNPNVINSYFRPFCQRLYELWGTAYFVLILPVLAGIFLVSVLLDQLRICAWRRLESPVAHFFERLLRRS